MNKISLRGQTFPGEYSSQTGYTPAVTDHYFLTEPAEFLFSHFPATNTRSESGDYSSRWQLVTNTITLAEFNKQPHLSSEFFTLGCNLVSDVSTPIVTEHFTEISIHAAEVPDT